MDRWRSPRLRLFCIALSGIVLASLVLPGCRREADTEFTLSPAAGVAPLTDRTLAPIPSFAPLVKRVRPMTVNINSRFKPRLLRGAASRPHYPPGFQAMPRDQDAEDPMERFRRFFGSPPAPEEREVEGLGSGLYIGDGLVLTNNHVVSVEDPGSRKFRPMDDIKVITDQTAPDGSREYPAKVVGTDPKSDIALIRIEGEHVKALKGVDIDVNDGEIVALIGANGAGKSTLMMTVCGNPRARDGQILFAGRDITRLPTHEIARLKLAQAPEGRRIFPRMTVLENLQMGAYRRTGTAEIKKDYDYMFAFFPRLKEREKQVAGTLSGGEQQMLAIARALMSKPRFLMLDEPSLGIAPILVKTIFSKIAEINQQLGITILLVEQNANLALEISDYGYVLETGRIILEDESAKLRVNSLVREAYLGG